MANRFIALIIFVVCLRAEIISLGTINSGMGISIERPDRSDIVSLELTFLKPGTGITNCVTFVTTNQLIELKDLPPELPDGRLIVAMRYLCLGGIKSDYRLCSMDLYRNAPSPPVAKATFVSISQTKTGGVSNGDGSGQVEAMFREVPIGESRSGAERVEKDSSPKENSGEPDLSNSGNSRAQATAPIPAKWRPPQFTNDAPVRRWNGAMIDPALQQAINEHFNKPVLLPPMPPATNGMQHRYWLTPTPVREIQQKARDEMLEFMKHGQKARKENQ